MIDVQKFSKELSDEVKQRFSESLSENGELASKVLTAMATIASMAIEKYDRENSH